MAINTTWKVEIGTVGSPVDFTSRVMSMNIRQSVDVNVIGRGQATITLLNQDGALTPGGGGTYSSTDWFAQGVFVNASTDTGGAATSTDVFDGIVVDFDLEDDGVFSTVTITAIDCLTVGGKSPGPSVASLAELTYMEQLGQFQQSASFGGTTLYLPVLGGTAIANIAQLNIGSGNPNTKSNNALSWPTLADAWQQSLIPSANDTMWATKIMATFSGNPQYHIRCIPEYNTPTNAYRNDFEFDPPSSLSGSKLPFDNDNFRQAFNNDTLITQATVKGNYTGATATTSSSGNVTVYGNRTVAYFDTLLVDSTAVANMSTKLINRYGTSRFTPVSLSVTASMVETKAANAAESKWRNLLSIENGIWQKVKVTWTGSGAASQTAYCIVKGRTISVTPADTIVTLDLGNWYDNHAFILDEDELDYGRLG